LFFFNFNLNGVVNFPEKSGLPMARPLRKKLQIKPGGGTDARPEYQRREQDNYDSGIDAIHSARRCISPV